MLICSLFSPVFPQIMTTKRVFHVKQTVHHVKTDLTIVRVVIIIWLCMNTNVMQHVQKTRTKRKISSKSKTPPSLNKLNSQNIPQTNSKQILSNEEWTKKKSENGRKYVRYVYLFSKYTIHKNSMYWIKGMNMGI